jgi:tRNA G10  N-methylase Trm11
MNYFFIPGRKWELSLAELKAVLLQNKVFFTITESSNLLFIIETKTKPDKITEVFRRMGGFTKAGEMISDPYEYIDSFLKERDDSKVNFAISAYSGISLNELFKLGMGIKGFLKERDFPCRFVSKRTDLVTSAPLLKKNKVLGSGFELNIIDTKRGRKWGRTLGIQDFEGFSKRDYDRPFPNREKGMTPPKLARIMINLAGIDPGKTIWDPFCGSGTILQEALLLDYNCIGSDSDPKSIDESIGNINWLKAIFSITDLKFDIFKQDATLEVSRDIKFDSIVTESYLGPVLRSVPGEVRVASIIKNVSELYRKFFVNIAPLCIKGTKIIFVVPEYKSRSRWFDVKTVDFLPSDFEELESSRNLHWDRPNSIIRRQIKIFVKK